MKVALPVVAVVASVGVGFAGITSAQTAGPSAQGTAQQRGMHEGMRPAVVGTVTAISGATLTVDGNKPGESTSIAYTIDASAATVMKASQGGKPAASTLASVVVGDTVAIRGTISGTNVTASEIVDGVMPHGPGGRGGPGMERGHGVAGTVSSISGNTITLTGNNGTIYTIDAGSADVSQVSKIAVGDIKVGDTLGVHGTVSGTNVSAEHIMDGIMPHQSQQ